MYTFHTQPSEIGEMTLADLLEHQGYLEDLRKMHEKADKARR